MSNQSGFKVLEGLMEGVTGFPFDMGLVTDEQWSRFPDLRRVLEKELKTLKDAKENRVKALEYAREIQTEIVSLEYAKEFPDARDTLVGNIRSGKVAVEWAKELGDKDVMKGLITDSKSAVDWVIEVDKNDIGLMQELVVGDHDICRWCDNVGISWDMLSKIESPYILRMKLRQYKGWRMGGEFFNIEQAEAMIKKFAKQYAKKGAEEILSKNMNQHSAEKFLHGFAVTVNSQLFPTNDIIDAYCDEPVLAKKFREAAILNLPNEVVRILGGGV